ncbi:MAG: hypothetical protein D6B25_04875 [Desulfobulbaceae bacterium]|nr:MAG: hypothetical protein D6B25_04875 [Desulfobulbaceae bacterium]
MIKETHHYQNSSAKLIPQTGLKEKNFKGSWNPQLPEMLIGEYLIIPLTSSKMLKSEGFWMQHCCRTFASRCADLDYCIFSIRTRSGERLATLGVQKDHDYWQFDQCYGPGNADVIEETFEYLDEDGELQIELVPTELFYVAQEVVRLMNIPEVAH